MQRVRRGARPRLLGALLVTVYLAVPMVLTAQAPTQGSVLGRVTNSQTGGYLEGAEVRILGLNREVTTNREGIFSFPRLEADTHAIQVSYLGIETQRVEAVVRLGETTALQVDLRWSRGAPASLPRLRRRDEDHLVHHPALHRGTHPPPSRLRGLPAIHRFAPNPGGQGPG